MDLSSFAKPTTAMTPVDTVRALIMKALTKESVQEETHTQVCSQIEQAMSQEDDTETQKYMHKMIGDGVANLREIVRSYYDLRAVVAPDLVKNMAASCTMALGARINTEATRLMSLLVGAMDPDALVDIKTNGNVYEKMTSDLNGFHDALSNDINSIMAELKNCVGK